MCDMGGNLVVSFDDGEQVSYGPCTRPPSIDLLWKRMLAAMSGV
jgi:hypothetical protein